MTTSARDWRFGLVLGGGALRGLAHIGALRALEEGGWIPEETMGTSMGALVAAAWCSGFGVRDLESIALQLRRRDIFQIAHADMALKRMQSPALYKTAPLRDLVRGLLGDVTFRELPRRLIVTSVEINSGQQVFWGLPGLDDVPVADAVMASCSLPGYFAPHPIRGRWWVDGALVDNLPVRFAAWRGWDGVLGVDVGASSVLRADTQEAGFAAVFARATEIVLQQSNEWHLRGWDAGPLLLVRPRVEHVPLLSFHHARELMAEGYRATAHDLAVSGAAWREARSGIFPRRRVQLRVMRERCVRCGACAALAPELFTIGADGIAAARAEPVEWSPVDGAVLRHCPTYAIMARPAAAPASTDGASTGTAPAPSGPGLPAAGGNGPPRAGP